MRPPPFSLLHGPGGCVRQVVCQKPRGQDSFPFRLCFRWIGGYANRGRGLWCGCLFGMSLRDGQLLAFGGDVIGIRRKPEIPVGVAVALGVASSSCITSLKAAWSSTVTCMTCAWAMGYIYMCVCFLVFNNSLDVGQQGFQLPDKPHHGVWHGI